MFTKTEIAENLRGQLKTTAEWLSEVSADTPQSFITWCLNYMQQLTVASQELSKIDLTSRDKPLAVKLSIPIKTLQTQQGGFSEYQKQALSVILALAGGNLPVSITEVAQKAWKKEWSEDTRSTLYQRANNAFRIGLPRIRSVVKTGQIPGVDREFYEKLYARYPKLTVLQLDQIIQHYQQHKSKMGRPAGGGQSKQQPRPGKDTEEHEGAVVDKPQTDWLQPVWAMLFHPKGASLDTNELIRRTGLNQQFLEPVTLAALKNLDPILAGKVASPEEEFTDAIASRWPKMNIAKILTSISTDAEGELSLVSLRKEISNVPQDKSPRAKTEETTL